MIRKLFTLVLLVVAVGGAYLSRPSKANFDEYAKTQYVPQQPQSLKSLGAAVFGLGSSEAYLQSIQFNDRVVYTTITKDGTTQFVGAFGKWFRTSAAPVPPAATAK